MKSSDAHALPRTHSSDRDTHLGRRPSLTPSLPYDAVMHTELSNGITDYARRETEKSSTYRLPPFKPEIGQTLQHEGADRKPYTAILGSQDGTDMLDLVRKTDVSQFVLVGNHSDPPASYLGPGNGSQPQSSGKQPQSNRRQSNGSQPQSNGSQPQSNHGQANGSRASSVKSSSQQQQSKPSTDEPLDLWPPVFIEKVPFQAASPEFALSRYGPINYKV